MLGHSNNNTNENIAIGAVAGVGAVQAGTIIYEKFLGDAYSEDDKKRLAELKILYRETLQMTSPVNWELDDKDCPMHRVRNQQWSLYIRQLREARRIVGHYYYQSSLMVKYASTYLIQRSSRWGWNGKGKSGDLIEQFFGELIDFALRDLPTYGFDDVSVRRIEQRIAYIDQVQKHESLFQFGTVKREKNKLDTIESIKQLLQTCIDIAAQESLRQCARENFDSCRLDIAALLLSAVQTIYYARATDVYGEPLELLSYIEPHDKFLTRSAKKLYPEIQSTHTGAMLAETISLAGIESFGTLGQQQTAHIRLRYYTRYGSRKVVDWGSLKSDLPPWVGEAATHERLEEFQALGESILRVAQVKHLVEAAYDLTGKVGDLWAYGDKRGKLSLKALLFLLEREVDLLKVRYDALYSYHNTHRHTYNLDNCINASKGANPNFNNVDAQKDNVDSLYTSIKESSQAIQEQMVRFPENATKRIDAKKREFYQLISEYFRRFHPENYSEYRLLEQGPRGAVIQHHIVNQHDEHKEENMAIHLTWPLKNHEQYPAYYYLDKAAFIPYGINDPNSETVDSLPTTWQLGSKYSDWMKTYFIHRRDIFDDFQRLALDLEEQVRNPIAMEDINGYAQRLNNHIQMMRQMIAEERPAWRFKWGIWPVHTKGWPFNRDANQFAELILREFDCTVNNINSALTTAQRNLGNQQAHANEPTPNVQPEQPLTLTPLDQEILNLISTPESARAVAAELSQLNHRQSEIDNTPEQIPPPQPLNQSAEAVNDWLVNVQTQFIEWQERGGRFLVFTRQEDPIRIFRDIVAYRSQLSEELAVGFMRTCRNFGDLLALEIECASNNTNVDSVAEMRLIITLIDVLTTEPNVEEKESPEDIFISRCQEILSRRGSHLAVQGYAHHGLLGHSPTPTNNVNNQVINSPTR